MAPPYRQLQACNTCLNDLERGYHGKLITMYNALDWNVGDSILGLVLIVRCGQKFALHLSCAWEYGRNPSNKTTQILEAALHNRPIVIKFNVVVSRREHIM